MSLAVTARSRVLMESSSTPSSRPWPNPTVTVTVTYRAIEVITKHSLTHLLTHYTHIIYWFTHSLTLYTHSLYTHYTLTHSPGPPLCFNSKPKVSFNSWSIDSSFVLSLMSAWIAGELVVGGPLTRGNTVHAHRWYSTVQYSRVESDWLIELSAKLEYMIKSIYDISTHTMHTKVMYKIYNAYKSDVQNIHVWCDI